MRLFRFAIAAAAGALCAGLGGPTAAGVYSRPGPASSLIPITGTYLPAPQNLHFTTDPAECARHIPSGLFVSLLCAAAIKNGDIVLVWDWSAALCPSTATCPSPIDGYRAYPRGNVNGAIAVATQAQGPDWTEVGVKAGAARCLTVKAFKGGVESDQSNIICVRTAQLGSRTGTLSFDRSLSRPTRWHVDCAGLPPKDFTKAELWVGYRDFISLPLAEQGPPGETPCMPTSQWARVELHFDLFGWRGKNIWKATLHLHALWSQYLADSGSYSTPQHLTDRSCAASIGMGKNSTLDADFFADLPSSADVDVNVTPQVSQWLHGTPNFGFVLSSGPDKETDRSINGVCITSFDDPTITVEYFP